mmetsp:Transcript_736/g.1704  ORF Transcript_736/g.1704 Transcript_736/m.1704 type:complete len:700 (-) Transcript_736:62-2161(-)
MLEVLAHADLPHQPVLVPVHAGELPHVAEDVLQAVGELEGVDVAEAELHVGVDDQLGEAQDLAAQVEGVAEAGLLALLGGQGLHGLEVEVVVQVQVVEVLAVDQQVQHVVALAAHLQPRLHPVQLRALEELRLLQRLEQALALEPLGRALVQLVEHVALEQLLVAHAHLDGVRRGAVLVEPAVDQRHVDGAPHLPAAHVERPRRKHQRDAVHGVVGVQRRLRQEGAAAVGQRELLLLLLAHHRAAALARVAGLVVRDGVDQRVVVERRQVGVLRLDVHHHGRVVRGHRHLARAVVVQPGERHLVLGAQRRADDELVDVVELVPVLVRLVHVPEQRLELRPARDAHVQRLGGEERLLLEQVEVVLVREVAEQLPGQAVQRGHDGQGQLPLAVTRAVHELGPPQRVVVVEPLVHRAVLVLVQLQLHRLQRVDVQQVVGVVQRRLLVVEGREAHALEVPAVALLAPHHDPHGAPLRHIHRLNHLGRLVDERDGPGYVVDHLAVPHLLPRHRHVLQQLEHRVGHELERAEVHALVVAELARRHVAVVLDDLAHVLRRHLLLLGLRVSELALLAIPLRVQLLPLASFLLEQRLGVELLRRLEAGGHALRHPLKTKPRHALSLSFPLLSSHHHRYRVSLTRSRASQWFSATDAAAAFHPCSRARAIRPREHATRGACLHALEHSAPRRCYELACNALAQGTARRR